MRRTYKRQTRLKSGVYIDELFFNNKDSPRYKSSYYKYIKHGIINNPDGTRIRLADSAAKKRLQRITKDNISEHISDNPEQAKKDREEIERLFKVVEQRDSKKSKKEIRDDEIEILQIRFSVLFINLFLALQGRDHSNIDGLVNHFVRDLLYMIENYKNNK